MKAQWILAPALASLGVALWSGGVPATPPAPGVTTTILATSKVDDLNLRATAHLDGLWKVRLKTHGSSDVYVVDNKLAPGSDTGRHSHPGPSLVMVVAGTVTNYMSDDPACLPHLYSAGSNFVDAGGSDSHLVRNEGAVPAETIAVQLLPAGSTRRIDEPVPANCATK